jgi:hypothetical protein
MTREEFIKVLNDKDYIYNTDDNRITILVYGDVDLSLLKILPKQTIFSNKGKVFLGSLENLSECIEFRNEGLVDLSSLTAMEKGIVFNNDGDLYLNSLRDLPEGIVFNNEGKIYLDSLGVNTWDNFPLKIDEIKDNILLNKMIELGLFDKEK